MLNNIVEVNKDFWKGFIAGSFITPAIAYSLFRFYWIFEIGIKYFKWHAILWLYLFIAFLFLSVGYWLYKSGRMARPTIQKLYTFSFGLLLAFYLAEIVLRLSGSFTTYLEQREGLFVDPAERAYKKWYLIYPPYQKVFLAAGSEYSFPRTTNSEGVSDVEWSTEKDSDEIRILTLGDSFTEGDGAPFDSSYPNLLAGLLHHRFPLVKITVMNGGRRGSDPWFEYKKLHDLFLKYHPDLVLYTNGSNDMLFDHLYYGGMERFAPDSTVRNRFQKHWWIGLYEVSHVFRAVMEGIGYDNTLMGSRDREENAKRAIEDSRQLSRLYSELGSQHHFACIQLVRPDKSEIKSGEYLFSMQQLTSGTDTLLNYSTADLLKYYRDSLHITDKNVDDYFWKIDAHHNPTGYLAMAKAVSFYIEPLVAKILNERKQSAGHLLTTRSL